MTVVKADDGHVFRNAYPRLQKMPDHVIGNFIIAAYERIAACKPRTAQPRRQLIRLLQKLDVICCIIPENGFLIHRAAAA